MKKHRTFLGLLLLSVGLYLNAQTSVENPAFPISGKPVTIDGIATDWPDSAFVPGKNTLMTWAVKADSVAVYCCVKIRDQHQQMRVMRNGMEFWVNTRGKKKKETGILYPLNYSLPPAEGSNLTTGGKPDPKKIRLIFLLQATEMELTGFREGMNGKQNVKSGKNGIRVAIQWDSANVMVYEAKIPLRTLSGTFSGTHPPVAGIILKGQESAANQHQPPQGQQGPGSGGEMQGGGMQGGGMEGSGRQGDMRPAPDGDHYGREEEQRLDADVESWREIPLRK